MNAISPKQDRIGARVPHEVYLTLCRAAELFGATVNQFLMQAALKEAQAVIERERVLRLSARDWDCLLDLMDNPPAPRLRTTGTERLATTDRSSVSGQGTIENLGRHS